MAYRRSSQAQQTFGTLQGFWVGVKGHRAWLVLGVELTSAG